MNLPKKTYVDKPEKVGVMECDFDVLVMEWGALAGAVLVVSL